VYDHTHIWVASLISTFEGLPITILNSASVIPSLTCLARSHSNGV
jgi:hypothetical protein